MGPVRPIPAGTAAVSSAKAAKCGQNVACLVSWEPVAYQFVLNQLTCGTCEDAQANNQWVTEEIKYTWRLMKMKPE